MFFFEKLFHKYKESDKYPNGIILDKIGDKVFSVCIKNGRLRMSPVNVRDCERSGPMLVFTPNILKNEQPLNLTISKNYLKKIGKYSKILSVVQNRLCKHKKE